LETPQIIAGKLTCQRTQGRKKTNNY